MPATGESVVTDTAVVTGGAGTLGRAIGDALAASGYRRIAIVDIDGAGAARTARSIEARFPGIEAVDIACDITDARAPARIVGELVSSGRHVTALVNNAGLNRRGSAADMTRQDWDAVLTVNVTAPMFLCQAAIPHWRESARPAFVVNLASRAWLAGSGTAYAASKAALIGLTHALSVELGPLGVRVNAVAPSYVESPFNTAARTEDELGRIADMQRRLSPLGGIARAHDVADAVAFFASGKALFITGETLYVAGGTQLAPNAGVLRASDA